MIAHQDLKKWGNMGVAERNLGTQREVGKSGVVNSVGEPGFTAAPMRAGIESESQPAVEIVGSAEANAAGVRFQAAAYREQCGWKLAVHIRAGMKEGVFAEKLPLRSLVLSCGDSGKRKQDNNHCRQ